MDWFKGNKQRSYTKKLINAIQKRKKEESEIITIGKTTPEVQQKRAVENTLIENQKEVKKKREEQKEEEQKTEDQLFVINNAKIKMGSHMGTFKVLNNTPTIQGKTVGTKVEKSPANFSFLDGFQILSVTGDWQDIGTTKYQDNEALIKKSTLMVTGKMPPPNAPIETGKIEFIDSGQINIPENINTTGMPVPENEQPDFDIKIKLIRDYFVPLGIPDFKGNKENGKIKFEIEISGKGVNRWHLQIKHRGILIKEIFSATDEIAPVTVEGKANPTNKKPTEEKPIEEEPRFWQTGTYIVEWDGFDKDDVYDSSLLTSSYGLDISIIGQAEQMKRIYIIEHTHITYDRSRNWVDVRIDRKRKIIETTLRVNLRDGGTRGLKCTTYDIDPEPKIRVENKKCPWDKIPKDILDYYKKEPIKTRTKTYEELRTMALQGIDKYWSRHADNIGKGVQIGDDFYEVFVKAVNTEEQAMDDIPLIYNTNNKWSRSGNPGGSYDDMNLDDDIIRLLPDGIIQRISYNVGYIQYANWKDLDTSHWLYKLKGWEYYGEIFENENFKETSAHEVGHEILQAIAGTTYSWQHKGSSYYLPQDTKPLEGEETFWDKVTHWDEMDTHGENYPAFGEIDLMKYYNGDKPKDFHKRIIATERDVLGLIWLSKIKIL